MTYFYYEVKLKFLLDSLLDSTWNKIYEGKNL